MIQLPTEPFDILPGWRELTICDHHGEVDIAIWQIKRGAEWLSCWYVFDAEDTHTYDSGYKFASHGAALDDALEFIQEAIINRGMDWGL